LTEPQGEPPFVYCHEPATPPTGFALCGHVHPGVRLNGPAFDSVRVPCVVVRSRHAILPAFVRLIGLAVVPPADGETLVAVARPRLFVLQ